MTKVEEHLVDQIHELKEASFKRICTLEEKYQRDISFMRSKYNTAMFALGFMTLAALVAICVPLDKVISILNVVMAKIYE